MYQLNELAALLGVSVDQVVAQAETSGVAYVAHTDKAYRKVSHTSAATIATALSKSL